MGNWEPFAYLLVITLIVGTFLTFLVTPFVDVTQVNPTNSDYINTMINYTQQDFIQSYNASILGFTFSLPSFNFLGLIPDFAENYIVADLVALSYTPTAILIPFIIMWILALIWTLVAIIKPGSS